MNELCNKLMKEELFIRIDSAKNCDSVARCLEANGVRWSQLPITSKHSWVEDRLRQGLAFCMAWCSDSSGGVFGVADNFYMQSKKTITAEEFLHNDIY